jgi:hypothetical protein
VDARLGFELRTPARWVRAPNARGLFAADGPVWDHDVSLEIFFWPYPTVEAFLDRFGDSLFSGTWRRSSGPVEIAGRTGLAVSVEDPTGEIALDFFFIELGDGRLMVILASCPSEVASQWRPWFEASLDTLEIR